MSGRDQLLHSTRAYFDHAVRLLEQGHRVLPPPPNDVDKKLLREMMAAYDRKILARRATQGNASQPPQPLPRPSEPSVSLPTSQSRDPNPGRPHFIQSVSPSIPSRDGHPSVTPRVAELLHQLGPVGRQASSFDEQPQPTPQSSPLTSNSPFAPESSNPQSQFQGDLGPALYVSTISPQIY